MAVLAEMYSVIIRVSTLESYFPGGVQTYIETCPNQSLCCDGEICRVGFMSWADVETFGEYLEASGFNPGAGAVAVTREDKGLVEPCDWLEFEHVDGTPVARLLGSTSDSLAIPPNWSPGDENELTHETEIQANWDRVDKNGGVETYMHRETGQIRYVGRAEALDPRRPWWRLWE